MITEKDQIFCAFIACVLTLCLKWFIVTETMVGGIVSTWLAWYFWRMYHSYCIARVFQENMKK